MKTTIKRWAIPVLICTLSSGGFAAERKVTISFDPASPNISFAAGELKESLNERGFQVTETSLNKKSDTDYQFFITTDENPAAQEILKKAAPFPELEDEGYAVRRDPKNPKTIWIVGGDADGAMYGTLDAAETIEIEGSVDKISEVHKNPHLDIRGIKFNIPLDARTPSYSDDGDAAQQNIAEMWSMDFWRDMLDSMARKKYNVLTLWSLHPFPSMVKVPGYESVALDDVWRTKEMFDAHIGGHHMWHPDWPVDVIKKMTIDEKIAHWRAVMKYAKERGVDVYVFTWNAFLHGTETSGFDFRDLNSDPTKDYFRKSVEAMYDTYPDLRGMGVTAGENYTSIKDPGQWMWDTYGEATKYALLKYPGRKIKFVHRLHYIDIKTIHKHFSQLPGYYDKDSSFDFSYKYSVAHMHSSDNPPDADRIVRNLPEGTRTWLTVRQDSTYMMRVGDPEFARRYIQNMPSPDKIAGIYVGPDGYTLGREFISTTPETPRQLVLDKQWYFFSLYGKLAYDPTIPTSHFQKVLDRRFVEVDGERLQKAWSAASTVFPLITRFYWGRVDYRWYPEACWRYPFGLSKYHTCSEEMGPFHTVDDFISPYFGPMNEKQCGQKTRFMSLKDYGRGVKNENLLTPPQVGKLLTDTADKALSLIKGLEPNDKELRKIVKDIEAMSYLGYHYANKIQGAAEVQLFRCTGDEAHQKAAVTYLTKSYEEWERYAAIISEQYIPQVLPRLSPPATDVNHVLPEIKKDIAQAKLPATDLDFHETFDTEKNGRFTINNAFRKWESPIIRIGNAKSVTVSADIKGPEKEKRGHRFLKIYYRINGEQLIPFSDNQDSSAGKTVTAENLSGKTIQILIKGKNDKPHEIYHVDNIAVVAE